MDVHGQTPRGHAAGAPGAEGKALGGNGVLHACTPLKTHRLEGFRVQGRAATARHPLSLGQAREARSRRGRPAFGYCCHPRRQPIRECSKSNAALKKKKKNHNNSAGEAGQSLTSGSMDECFAGTPAEPMRTFNINSEIGVICLGNQQSSSNWP